MGSIVKCWHLSKLALALALALDLAFVAFGFLLMFFLSLRTIGEAIQCFRLTVDCRASLAMTTNLPIL